MRAYLLVALITAVISYLATWGVRFIAKKYDIHPAIRERDVHKQPTPRIGGVAIFIAIASGVVAAGSFGWFESIFRDPGPIWAILGAGALIVVVGLLDDLIELDWTAKMGGQVAAAWILASSGVQIVSLPIGGLTVGSFGVSLAITVFVVVLVMNAVNFIDGLDGLAAGVVGIGTMAFFIYSYLLAQQTSPTNYFSLAGMLSAVVLGAIAGFLPHNFSPAKIFMGDSGAMLLGLMMATSAIAVTGSIDPATVTRNDLLPALIPLVLPVIILILPLLDLLLAVVRRIRRGQSPFAADREHLHHQLQDLGHSHRGAVLVFYHWTALVSVTLLLFFWLEVAPVIVIFGAWMILALIHTYWPVFKRVSKARGKIVSK
ncbi:MAG: undecaprenyl/decaprenyl-phosphate alpha-N-acetylglucosaminyl 1-phosphate transferase [Micrococcales bacterium]|nr:undecaprenyl/decaprenyl-phosphate alpha-N-acetylglucosaminyl 1-phosphate transferase [Micrococcales bacterium]HBB39239.1 undecaprenyl-phosphate alpha-N-acetylglucosaminyl 1-phosphate transferase [Aquiluna sp.]MBT5397942.1 undecaprenyl/decaprenyl-phosphate alpha-N-acetylglucosaminyl 1-phosphate transferase [Micrococcales bacterium]MBT5431539.1 undecaprenyl/decaprenyl-phosphate alpha-N-acetylglucosaminyl 1-phosphate transferase [Micrococcales bacterium]MBT5847927.1 undecaprenyl/decaprenyl-phos